MGLLNDGVTFINFDETYFAQRRLQTFDHAEIDVRGLEHVNLFCEEDSIRKINELLQKRYLRGITFIGSGNYHYLTYLLLQEMTIPFTLILFDNHTDMAMNIEQSEDLLSCGSWVSFALNKIPLLQRVVIIGPTTLPAHFSTDPRVIIFPFNEGKLYSWRSILSEIHTQSVYISIDKDVLNRAAAITNWDQGVMEMRTFVHYLEAILSFKEAAGVDVCGEIHLNPLDMLLPNFQGMIQVNDSTNVQILETCLKMSAKRNNMDKMRLHYEHWSGEYA